MDTIKNARLKALVASIKAKTQQLIAGSRSIQQQLEDECAASLQRTQSDGMLKAMGYMPMDE